MSYDKAELEKKALAAIKRHKLVFIQDIIAYLPCSSSTFYNLELEKLETLKDALEDNKTRTKVELRKKWQKSDNATVQVALYKIIGTDEEAERLNGSKQKVEQSGTINHNHTIDPETIKAINEAYDNISE